MSFCGQPPTQDDPPRPVDGGGRGIPLNATVGPTGVQGSLGLLQPIAPAQQHQPPPASSAKPAAKLGATWADTRGAINIDVDNLLAPRSPKSAPAPSINQLKSSPNSPSHAPPTYMQPPPLTAPLSNNFMQAPLNNNFIPPPINNNFARPPFTNQGSFLQ
ncbi:unnamed protein product, partial [Iphiclides podalirius]